MSEQVSVEKRKIQEVDHAESEQPVSQLCSNVLVVRLIQMDTRKD